MMCFHKISNPCIIHTPELKERAQHSGYTIYTQHYIVCEDNIEIAFVSVDLWPVDKPFALYELFVAREHRNKGIGSEVLRQIEKMAIEKGYRQIVLTPKSIDKDCDNRTQCQIMQWYETRGYCRSSEFERQFEKQLKG